MRKHYKAKPQRSGKIRCDFFDGIAVRSYPEIAKELEKRHGIKISDSRVWQHLQSAHKKIAAALRSEILESI